MRRFLIVVMIVLFLLPNASNVVDLSAEDNEAYAVAGLLAYLPVEEKTEPEPNPVEKKCECNKTTGKISYDGGTSWTDCPCKFGKCDCGCKNANTQTQTSVSVEVKLPRVILVTDTENCVPCKKVDRDIVQKLSNDAHKKSGWKVGDTEDCHLQIIDKKNGSLNLDLKKNKLKISMFPSFYLITKDGVQKTHIGYMSYNAYLQFANPIAKRNNSLFGRVGTSHESRETLIKHLMEGSIHKGKHNLNDLNQKSDDELNELHERDHNT